MATLEQRSMQWNPPRLLSALAILRFTPFTYTHKKQTGKWTLGGQWPPPADGTTSKDVVWTLEESCLYLQGMAHMSPAGKHITTHIRRHGTHTTPVGSQAPYASFHWQVSGCPCGQTSMKDKNIMQHALFFALPLTNTIHFNYDSRSHRGEK